MMIQIAIMENSWKMIINQMIKMRDLMQEEASFRRELSDSLKQSNDNFLKAMDSFNKTVSQLGNGLCISIDMLARAMYMSNQATQNQNMYFQIIFPMFIPLFLTIFLRMFLFHDQIVM